MRPHDLWVAAAFMFVVVAAVAVSPALGLFVSGVACGGVWWLFGDVGDGE